MRIYTKTVRRVGRIYHKLQAIRAIIGNESYVVLGTEYTFAAVVEPHRKFLIKEAKFAISKLKEPI